MNKHDRIHPLLPEFIFGTLPEADMLAVADHITDCDICRAELQAYQAIVDDLALLGPVAAPAPDLEKRLMARVQPPVARHSITPPRGRLWQRIQPVWAVISSLLIIGLGISTLNLWQQLHAAPAIEPDDHMQAIPLLSTNKALHASGFILVSGDGHRGAVVVDDLPPLSTDQQYQLWLDRDGQDTSGAVFSVDDEGYGLSWITAPDSIFSYTTAGVSIEPAGGSPDPTGDQVMSCSLK